MKIHDSIHPHPLFLREDIITQGVCFICLESIVGNPFYVCEDCKVYIHKRCVELPSVIDHPFHLQHPLELRHGVGFYCDSCHRKFEEKPRYMCVSCNFDLDVKCSFMPKINPEGIEFIQHFSHQHPMSLCSQDHDKFLICFACKKITSEVLYGCSPCAYFLHKSCSELPSPVLHILHPQHALHLLVQPSLCQICNVYDYTFKYSCDGCDFSLDVSCWIEYPGKKEGQNLQRDCFICSKQHLDSISCIDSKYLLNQICISLPKEINPPIHSYKPLQLLAPNDFWCYSCYKWFDTKLCYGCCESNFHMDVTCALMPMVKQNEGVKYLSQSLPYYFSHQHPLFLITVDFGIVCSVCQMTCPSPIYGCIQCQYFLHQSCIELPSEIESPLHGQHNLTIELVHNEYCQLCLKKYSGFFFGCVECTFYVGFECYSLIPKFNIRYPYHEHPLCLVEKSYLEKCNPFCGITKLSSTLKLTQAYLLRCVQCNYNVHLLCSRLPCNIKDKNHLHCITLTKFVVEDDCDDYYCDICEEERDPRSCVYYCKECDFVSHVHCVRSEILNAWEKDRGQVELRIAKDLNLEEGKYKLCYNASGKVLNFKDVLDSLSEEETKEIEENFPRAKLYGEDEDYSETKEEDRTSKYQGNDIIKELSMCNEVDIFDVIEERLKRFQPSRKYHIQPDKYDLQVVEVEDYMITFNFAHLLSALFMKYGDFIAPTRFSKNFKCVISYLFCYIVDDMRSRCLADLTEKQLISWDYYFDGVWRLWFDVKFSFRFMQRAILSFAGLQAMKLEGELHDKVALEIADLEGNISEIKSQIERRKSYLLQYKPGNDQWRVYAKKHKWRTLGNEIV